MSFRTLGGRERDCLALAAHLAARGHRVQILANNGPAPDLPPGISFRLIGSGSAYSNHGKMLAMSRRLDAMRRARDCDALIAFDKLPGCDYHYVTGIPFPRSRNPLRCFFPRDRAQIGLERELFAPPSSTHVFFLTEGLRRAYEDLYGIPAERSTVLPLILHGDRPAPDAFYTTRDSVRTELGLPLDKPVAVIVATKAKQKGVDRFFAAIAANAGLYGLVIGTDGNAASRLTRRYGVADRVRVEPYRADVPRLLGASDFMIHPARVEATGLVILEGLLAGLPVIASRACGYGGEIARANAGMWLDEPFVAGALTQAVRDLLADLPAARMRAQKAARDLEASDNWMEIVTSKIQTDFLSRKHE